MPPVGFEPTISEGERPQNYALDRAAIGTDIRAECCSSVVRSLLLTINCASCLTGDNNLIYLYNTNQRNAHFPN